MSSKPVKQRREDWCPNPEDMKPFGSGYARPDWKRGKLSHWDALKKHAEREKKKKKTTEKK